jgi:hypothetical protein
MLCRRALHRSNRLLHVPILGIELHNRDCMQLNGALDRRFLPSIQNHRTAVGWNVSNFAYHFWYYLLSRMPRRISIGERHADTGI